MYDESVSRGFEVYLAERLHAKLYFNSERGILASVNFNKSSQDNSEEIGIFSMDSGMIAQFKAYRDDLIEISDQKWGEKSQNTVQPTISVGKTGYCIRKGVEIPFNIEMPLSDAAFKTWSIHKDKKYAEKYCHFSGDKSDGKTWYSRPILRKNWNAAKKKHNL